MITAMSANRKAAALAPLLWFVAVILVLAMASLITIKTDIGSELNPPRVLETWADVIGVSLGAICVIVSARQRPITARLVLTTTVLAPLTAAISAMMMFGILSRIHEAITFRGDRLVSYESDLRVWSASIHHYRGSSTYQLLLRDYPRLFEISSEEYRAAFGRAEYLRPIGYCVKVTVQSTGLRGRIMARDGMILPRGSLRRCHTV